MYEINVVLIITNNNSSIAHKDDIVVMQTTTWDAPCDITEGKDFTSEYFAAILS